MFTGIIETTGKIETIAGNLFTISHPFSETLEIGESIALSGMCATVIKSDEDTFTVEIMEESRNKTIFGEIKEGEPINLERSAQIGARNSGHFVLGHIDQVGEIIERKNVEDYVIFRIAVKQENQKYLVHKGSVAVDGISLTVSGLGENFLEVSIISHTLENTTLGNKQTGDKVNLEFDVLGKYSLKQELDETYFTSKTILKNIAFIDGQNLHLGVIESNWKIDYQKLRIYLHDKYGIKEAYYFFGYVIEEQQLLYKHLQKSGYTVLFKEHKESFLGKKKGNVDSDIVFEMMKFLTEKGFDKMLLISGDGDYKKVVDYLISKNRFKKIIFPNKKYASSLYKKLGSEYYDFLDNEALKKKLQSVKEAP